MANPTENYNPIVGQLITLSAEYQQKKVDTDPTTPYFAFKKPGSTTSTTYTYGTSPQMYKDPVAPKPGFFYVDLNLDTPGRWYWGFYASGKGQAVVEGYFDVQPSTVF